MRDPAGGLVPPGTLFGAVIAAAGEGGFNGPGQPENQWWSWERTGRAVSLGLAGDVFAHPEPVLDRAAAAGCEVLVLPVEWARVEPSPGRVDAASLERYARTVARCAARGIVPMVTLHDRAHPAWLGAEFWLTPGSPDRFADHVARVVDALGASCRHWVTMTQPNRAALAGWVGGHSPPGRVAAFSDAWSVLDNCCTAHVLAYDVVHDRQADAVVTFGLVAPGPYDWHRLPVDLMMAPALGVARGDVHAWVEDRRREHAAELPPSGLADLAGRRVATLLSPYGHSGRPVRDRLRARRAAASPERLLDAVYGRATSAPLDAVTVVWDMAASARSARPDALGPLGWLAGAAPAAARLATPWDAPVGVDGLGAWCRAVGSAVPGLPLWVHAGLTMPPGGAARLDGWDRPSYLRAAVAQVVDLVAGGTPVAGFCYRDLGGAADRAGTGADIGLFSVAPATEGDAVTWEDVDATGAPAGEAYRRLVAAVRAGDRATITGGVPPLRPLDAAVSAPAPDDRRPAPDAALARGGGQAPE